MAQQFLIEQNSIINIHAAMSDRKEKHIVITMQSGLKPKNYPVKTL